MASGPSSPRRMKAYDSFSDWKKDQSPANRRLIGTLEKIAAHVAPQLQQSVKWGQGCWMDDDGPKFYIHAEPDHVQLGFYNGVALRDPHSLLEGKGKYVRFVRIRTATDIDEEALGALVKQVV